MQSGAWEFKKLWQEKQKIAEILLDQLVTWLLDVAFVLDFGLSLLFQQLI